MEQEEYFYENVYLNGINLEYIVSNPSCSSSKQQYYEPVVFIHGSMLSDANLPLIKEAALRDRYFLISYHRRGFQRSKHFEINNNMNDNNNYDNYHNYLVPSISQDAADCRCLIDYLGFKTAHVVGHSQGGAIALQFVIDYPDYVHSLSLLEPALVGFIPNAQRIHQQFEPIIRLYNEKKEGEEKRNSNNNKEKAIDAMMKIISGENYREMIEKVLPGSFEQAVSEAYTLFENDMPAMQSWTNSFSPKELIKKIDEKKIPVLCVLGADTQPMFKEIHEQLLLKWLPDAETLVIPNATHWLQLSNPKSLAEGLANFFDKHT